MVATQPVIACSFGAGMEVRNGNTGIVAALSADHLGAGERIHLSESGAAGKFRIDPTCLQRAERVPDHQLLRGQDAALFGAGTLMSLSKAFAQARE